MIKTKKHYIKGFTITELAVVISITALIFVLTVFIYLNFRSYYSFIDKNNDYSNEVIQLKNIVSYQCFKSEYIESNEQELKFTGYDGNILTLSFIGDYILINNQEILDDTIRLNVNSFEVTKLDNSKYVNMIKITVENGLYGSIELIFSKKYDNRIMYELTEKNVSKYQ